MPNYNPSIGKMGNIDTHELAWCSGFFDGEGNSNCHSSIKENKTSLRISVSQKSPLLLYRFKRIIGGHGIISEKRITGVYELRISRFETIQYVMCLLWRYLGSPKREQYKNEVRFYLSKCWKPKFDEKSIRSRDVYKRGTKALRNRRLFHMLSLNSEKGKVS